MRLRFVHSRSVEPSLLQRIVSLSNSVLAVVRVNHFSLSGGVFCLDNGKHNSFGVAVAHFLHFPHVSVVHHNDPKYAPKNRLYLRLPYGCCNFLGAVNLDS